MNRFKYKAHRPGEQGIIQGEGEAEDKFHLSRQMREQGLILISAEEQGMNWLSFDYINELVVRIPLHEKVIFANNLSAMIGAGLALSRALEVLGKQTNNVRLRKTILEILKDVNSGLSLSQSLAKFPDIFPAVFVAMVAAGEESGNLPQSLKLIGEQMEKTYVLRRKLRGAMAYPTIIFIAMIIIGFLMLTFVVPNIVSTFQEFHVDLPLSTQIVIGLSNILVNYWVYVILAGAVMVGAAYKTLGTDQGRRFSSYLTLHLPFISSLTQEMNSATAARTLSSLILSGVSIVESLDITSKVVQNLYYRDILLRAKDGVQKGDPLSAFFQNQPKLFPVMVGEMIAVGEETGKLSVMLGNVAQFYEDEVEAVTKDMSTIIEPVLMIIIGLFVGFFAISMIQPIYSITSAI